MRITLVFLSLFFITSCKKDLGDCFKSTGEITTEIRPLTPFRAIEVNDNVDVYIMQDSILEARVEAGDNLIGKIKTEVVNGILKISNENDCNWVRSLKNKFKVYISTPDLTELTCYGTGTILSSNTITVDTLLIDLWETYSNISLSINTQYVHAKNHTGPGDIHLLGSSDFVYAYSTGNGFIYCDGLITRKTWVIHGGTGEIYVNAQDTLRAEINYIGNIYYSGQPSTIDLNDNGDGNLVPLN